MDLVWQASNGYSWTVWFELCTMYTSGATDPIKLAKELDGE